MNEDEIQQAANEQDIGWQQNQCIQINNIQLGMVRTNGFKSSACKVANCLGCKGQPPTLSADTLQEIGVNMCQINADEIDEATLSRKKKPKPIAKKKGKSQDNDEANEGEGPSKNKRND